MDGPSFSPDVSAGKGLRARLMCGSPAFAAGLAVPSLGSRGEGSPLGAILHTKRPANLSDLSDMNRSPGTSAPLRTVWHRLAPPAGLTWSRHSAGRGRMPRVPHRG